MVHGRAKKSIYIAVCIIMGALAVGASAATTETGSGLSRITSKCSGTTYVAICRGQTCEYGTSNNTIPPGGTWETHVQSRSGYCHSCNGTPNINSCHQYWIPLR